jgi:hypothetical protein
MAACLRLSYSRTPCLIKYIRYLSVQIERWRFDSIRSRTAKDMFLVLLPSSGDRLLSHGYTASSGVSGTKAPRPITAASTGAARPWLSNDTAGAFVGDHGTQRCEGMSWLHLVDPYSAVLCPIFPGRPRPTYGSSNAPCGVVMRVIMRVAWLILEKFIGCFHFGR